MNLTDLASSALSRLRALLEISQQSRLLQLETALPSATLVVERAAWSESVSGRGAGASLAGQALGGISAEVDALSTSAGLELKALLGEQMSLRLMGPDGHYRPWHGYVTQAAQLGSDGGLSRYRLQLRPFTHLMTPRRDARVFLGQRADAIAVGSNFAWPRFLNFTSDCRGQQLRHHRRATGVELAWAHRLPKNFSA